MAKDTDHISSLVLTIGHSHSNSFWLVLNPLLILQASLLFPLCFDYTHDYVSYTQRVGKKISWASLAICWGGKGPCEFNLFSELK